MRLAQRRAALLVCTTALVLVSLGSLPAHARPEVSETTHFLFKAPRDFTGRLAARLRFEWQGENTCSGVVAASGPRRGWRENPVHYWTEWRSATTFNWGSLSQGSNLQIHAAGAIDSRSLDQTSGNWAIAGPISGTFTDYLEVTYRAFGLAAWNTSLTDAPVWIELTCQQPFIVSGLEAGIDGRSFTRDSLNEGVGASVNYLILPEASVSVGDKLRHTLDESTVLFDVRLFRAQNTTSLGRFTLQHPQGTESWEPSGNPYTDEIIHFSGGPGAYELTLDRVVAGDRGFLGSLVGLDAVDCLDQALGLACPETPTPTPTQTSTSTPTPTPTPTPTQSPQPSTTDVSFTESSATSGQHSDQTFFEARLTDANGDPIEGAELTFELTGSESARSFTATTSGDGLASVTPTLEEKPGPHQLTVHYEGDENHEGSADTASFVVDKEDAATELSVQGQGNSKRLRARLADLDTSTDGIAERTIDFYSDGELIGSDQTDHDGVATLAVPPEHRGANRTYDAIFEGDDFYLPSSDTRAGKGNNNTDRTCTAATPVVGATVANVVVPEGESCTITGSTVNGNVKAEEDSSLDASGNTIKGNVEGDKAEKLRLADNNIGGNVTIKEGEDSDGEDVDVGSNTLSGGSIKVEKMAGDISITDNTVAKGDIEVIENTIGQDHELAVDGNSVTKGSLKVEKNKGSGEKSVTNNEGGQTLECKDNDDPFTGEPNGTWKEKKDQCAGDAAGADAQPAAIVAVEVDGLEFVDGLREASFQVRHGCVAGSDEVRVTGEACANVEADQPVQGSVRKALLGFDASRTVEALVVNRDLPVIETAQASAPEQVGIVRLELRRAGDLRVSLTGIAAENLDPHPVEGGASQGGTVRGRSVVWETTAATPGTYEFSARFRPGAPPGFSGSFVPQVTVELLTRSDALFENEMGTLASGQGTVERRSTLTMRQRITPASGPPALSTSPFVSSVGTDPLAADWVAQMAMDGRGQYQADVSGPVSASTFAPLEELAPEALGVVDTFFMTTFWQALEGTPKVSPTFGVQVSDDLKPVSFRTSVVTPRGGTIWDADTMEFGVHLGIHEVDAQRDGTPEGGGTLRADWDGGAGSPWSGSWVNQVTGVQRGAREPVIIPMRSAAIPMVVTGGDIDNRTGTSTVWGEPAIIPLPPGRWPSLLAYSSFHLPQTKYTVSMDRNANPGAVTVTPGVGSGGYWLESERNGYDREWSNVTFLSVVFDPPGSAGQDDPQGSLMQESLAVVPDGAVADINVLVVRTGDLQHVTLAPGLWRVRFSLDKGLSAVRAGPSVASDASPPPAGHPV